MIDEQIRTGVSVRSAGTRRLRRLSRGAALGTAALAALLTAVAARSNPAHKHARTAQTVPAPQAATPAVRKAPPPPALPGDSSSSSASAVAPLAQSVVVSGGS
jgi:hypothetical protein